MWLLLRRPSGALSVELDALADADSGRRLASYPTRPEAVAAREEQEQRDKVEALRAAGQRDLFGGEE